VLSEEELIHLAILDIRLENDDDPGDNSGLELSDEIDPVVARIILTGYPPEKMLPGAYSGKVRISFADRITELYLVSKTEGPEAVLKAVKRALKEEFEITPERRIAVLTSGGDSPGMNAAIWAIVRVALDNDIEVLGFQDGYQGLTEDLTYRLTWNFVSDILVQGGTILGTARFPGYEVRDIREKAVENIVRKQISGLIVIGGDGSMKGAQALVQDLEALGRELQVVAIPGTIDNDLWGTDMSLGAASAANAMIEELRNMIRPAQALRRIFVCEVMGHHCGYLALQAALGIGADAVIIPEKVVVCRSRDLTDAGSLKDQIMVVETEDNFRKRLAKTAALLHDAFDAGKRYGFVVLSEGERLLTNERLDAKYVQQYLEDKIKRWPRTNRPDVRAHVLGYPVRGCPPCRFDIWLGARLGAAAVQCLLEDKTDVMVGWSEEEGIIDTPFDEVIKKSSRSPQEMWNDRPKWQELLELQEALACPPQWRQQLKERGNRFVQ